MKITKDYLRGLIKETMDQMGNAAERRAASGGNAEGDIFLVLSKGEYESDSFFGVFKSLEEAKAFLASMEKESRKYGQSLEIVALNFGDTDPHGMLI